MTLPYTLHQGDCLETLRGMADNSVDSIVTDPPYGLAFMGKKWDYDVPKVEVWQECLRVLKPGGHLLAFAGTRTQHRMAVRIEDAGFEIRDMIFWCYASGFPKSLDVSKAIDGKLTTGRSDSIALREVNETRPGEATVRPTSTNGHRGIVGSADAGPSVKRDEPATAAARQWQGWGTALKPALEPITVARKPLGSTVAECVLAHGTGALNIDGCRVGTELVNTHKSLAREAMPDSATGARTLCRLGKNLENSEYREGRWPANLIHDGSPEVLVGFPDTGPSKAAVGVTRNGRSGGIMGEVGAVRDGRPEGHDDAGGSAARFFYTAKASSEDRDTGVAGVAGVGALRDGGRESAPRANTHPTVKPTDLMRYLVRLVTPPGGTVLDPFNGSGSTGKACMLEGFAYIGCELDPAYIEISRARIEHAIALRASGAEKLHPASERDDKTIDLFAT